MRSIMNIPQEVLDNLDLFAEVKIAPLNDVPSKVFTIATEFTDNEDGYLTPRKIPARRMTLGQLKGMPLYYGLRYRGLQTFMSIPPAIKESYNNLNLAQSKQVQRLIYKKVRDNALQGQNN